MKKTCGRLRYVIHSHAFYNKDLLYWNGSRWVKREFARVYTKEEIDGGVAPYRSVIQCLL